MTDRQIAFDKLSETGRRFAYYKHIGDCPCVGDKDELFNEPDPTHKDCFGTGNSFELTLTPKIRYFYAAVSKTSNLEIQWFERIKDNMITIFFPYYLKPKYKDIICSLKHTNHNELIEPGEVEYVYRVLAVDEFIENGFVFYSVKAAKLQHAPFSCNI